MTHEATGPVADLPEWELAFRFTSGRLCLAFCATVGERWRRNFERLRQPEDLARWVVAAGLLDRQPEITRERLRDARILREAVYRAVRAGMAGGQPGPADRDILNTWARRPDLAPQLSADSTVTTWPGRDPGAGCLARVARDAVDLLGGPSILRVRECAADDCALLFLDQSRPGQRRWCSDTACGSRARSASYRRRHADAT